ncbi:MAG: hypothetical protein RLZZ630_1476 [Bacteroidota bacterium]|jgi:uncharacterized protein (TIGR02145 family)
MIRLHQLLLLLLVLLTAVSCEKANKDDDQNKAVCSVAGDSIAADIDGHVYHVVSIGGQCWLKENLRTTRYRNGDSILTGLTKSEWRSTTSGAWVHYGFDTAMDSVYGKLYNYYAVADARGLCPSGWHVPAQSEWEALETHLAGTSVSVGGALKDTGTIQSTTGYWSTPNLGATNSSGFTALPGGTRLGYDTTSVLPFASKSLTGYWWSSSSTNTVNAHVFFLGHSVDAIGAFDYEKANGFSVRCVKD